MEASRQHRYLSAQQTLAVEYHNVLLRSATTRVAVERVPCKRHADILTASELKNLMATSASRATS
eukprot:6462989-Amphidinium_carterae.2